MSASSSSCSTISAFLGSVVATRRSYGRLVATERGEIGEKLDHRALAEQVRSAAEGEEGGLPHAVPRPGGVRVGLCGREVVAPRILGLKPQQAPVEDRHELGRLRIGG